MSFLSILLVLLAAANIVALIVVFVRMPREGGGGTEKNIREDLRVAREESAAAARLLREEVAGSQKSTAGTMLGALEVIGKAQGELLESVSRRIGELTESNEKRIDGLRSTIDEKLKVMQEGNEKKLDQMRATVEEKLQDTLEKRLGESFRLVSDRLEAVQRGLGEMQTLATGVGDLKKVLTNVKTRGTWGEIQLGALLEQIMTAEQYGTNVQTKEGSADRVEFAIRLPGAEDYPGSCVWLPIDSKFPQEDYLRLVEASEAADPAAVLQATAALIKAVHSSAKDIRDKYIDPPRTTDFGIMFLPTEGLYAEVLRQSGEVERLQREYRVVVAGPTTLAAILSSLRMGFRTLAIEKRSSEVWKVLSAVKTEFGKFGEILGKVKKQLSAASNTIEQTGRRTRAMEKKLRDVEELPGAESSRLLELPSEGESDGMETDARDDFADAGTGDDGLCLDDPHSGTDHRDRQESD